MVLTAIVGIVGVVGIVAIVYGRRLSSRAHLHGSAFQMDITRQYTPGESLRPNEQSVDRVTQEE